MLLKPIHLVSFLIFTLLVVPIVTAEETKTDEEKIVEIHTLLQEGKVDEGLKKLDDLLEKSPNNKGALATRLTYNVTFGKNFDQVIKDITAFAKLVEDVENGAPSVYVEVGNMYADFGRYKEVVKLMDIAIPKYPNYPERYLFHLLRAYAYQEQENFPESIKDYRESISLKPDNGRIRAMLAKVYSESGDNENALVEINKAIEIDPKSDFAYHTRYNIYSEMKEYEKALIDIQKAAELAAADPKLLGYYMGAMALTYKDLGRMEEAQTAALHSKVLGEDFVCSIIPVDPDTVLSLKRVPIIPGCILIYEVDNIGKRNFVVQVGQKTPEKMELNWMMGDDPDMRGTVNMSADALAHATKLHNYFKAGEVNDYKDTTCVWVSKDVYQSLKKGEPIEIDTGRGVRTFKRKGVEQYRFVASDVNVEMPVIRAESVELLDGDSPEIIWVLDDPDDPIIYAMDLGWTVKLKRAIFIKPSGFLNKIVSELPEDETE